MATIPASENEFPRVLFTEGAAPSAPASGLIVAYAKAGGVFAWKDDAGGEHIVGEAAPPAVDVTFDPTGLAIITASDVQAALEEVDAAIGAGGIPSTTVDAKGDLIAATADDTVTRLAVGTNGHVLTAASGEATGLKWAGKGLIDYDFKKITSGNKSLTSTTWANLDTAMDLTVDAIAGDILDVTLIGLYDASTVFTAIDCMTLVGGSGVNWFGSGELTTVTGDGVAGWGTGINATVGMGATVSYVVQSGDISAGTVTLRLRYRVSAASRTLRAQAADPLFFQCKVLRV